MERLAELRGLVAQIAADVGLDAGGLLQGEVEALGQKLQDVRESLTTLADVAETRANGIEACNGELDDTRKFLTNVQKVSFLLFFLFCIFVFFNEPSYIYVPKLC